MSGGAPPSGGETAPLTETAAATNLRRLRISARRGGASAQVNLARALVDGGVADDAVEAAGWFRRASEGGHVDAMEWMWGACKHGAPGVPVDAAESYRWAVRAAEAGSAVCQTDAGYALVQGLGVANDEAAGVRWFRRAADAGDTQAQFNLHVCHRDGLGGLRPGDPAGAAWLRKAAEDGVIEAQAELSRCLRAGDGMPADVAEANTWGLRAAEGGHTWAQADMGRHLLRGEGIATDTVAGVALLRRAVDAGELGACLHLGDAHAAGLGGLPVDKAAARALYERAAAGGNAELAATARRALYELSSPGPGFNRIALPAEVPPVCGNAACGTALDAGTLSGLCAGCRAVRYCPTGCQRAAWPAHRAACKAAVAARAAALAAAPSTSSSASPPTAPTAALTVQLEEMEVWARMPLDALRAAAGAGTAAAQGAIGIAHLEGTLGLEADAEAACTWLRKAAEQGFLPAQYNLGATVYRQTLASAVASAHVPLAKLAPRLLEALDLCRPAAAAGDESAQFAAHCCCEWLARLLDGVGDTGPLFAEAGQWLRAAAAQSEPLALNTLGVVAWDGHPWMGVPRARAEARRLFAAADAAGLAEEERAGRPGGAPGSMSPL